MLLSVGMALERATFLLVSFIGDSNDTRLNNNRKAIRFVLSDAYTSLTNVERRSLLHEGVSMSAAISAFGESIIMLL